MIIGMAEGQVLFFVAYTGREEDVRIISPGGQHPSRQASPDGQPFINGSYVHLARDLGPSPSAFARCLTRSEGIPAYALRLPENNWRRKKP